VSWSYKYGNKQQIATVHFNLAQALQTAKKYTLARKNYLATITYAEQALDLIRASHAKLYLAEIMFKQGEKAQAQTLLLSLDKDHFINNALAKYNELNTLL